MRLTGTALRLTIMIGESDRWHHKPLYTEIVHRAHKAGLAGATVLQGVEGFGATSLIHSARLLSLSDDLPVVIIMVDTHGRIDAFLPQLEELVSEGLVILDDCQVIRYVGAGHQIPGAV
jgi:PII-like signaling protein